MKSLKKGLIMVFVLVFFISLAYAQGCADEGWKGYSKIHENKTIVITCPTCDFINITVTNADNNLFIINDEMTKVGSTFSYTFNETSLNKVGVYMGDGYSNLDLPLAFCFDVSMTGNKPSPETYILLIILSVAFFILLIWINIKFNLEKRNQLYNKMVNGFFNSKSTGNKNLGKILLYTLAYGILNNMIVLYYLTAVFFMFMATELVESFGITSLILLFTTVLNITLLSSIIIFLVLFFSFYELISYLIKDVADMQRGIVNAR